MGYVPLICRCYEFLYIRLPFYQWFLRSAKTYSFCFSKEQRFRIQRYGIPYLFSFLNQSFVEPHTVISEVCFKNRELHSSILGVILCFLGVISLALSIILCLLSVILDFLSTFSAYIFAIMSTIFIIQRIFSLYSGSFQGSFWRSYYRTCYH